MCCTLQGRQLRRPSATKARARLRAAGKSLTAPLDRVKLLLQTRGGLGKSAVAAAARGGGVLDALAAIGREEGIRGYWKGNLPQARCCGGAPAWLPRPEQVRLEGKALRRRIFTFAEACSLLARAHSNVPCLSPALPSS
jgi:hypothetical protein